MPKQSGLGDNFYVGGFDLSGDVNSLSKIDGGPALLDITTINKSANARLGGLRDGGMDFTTFMDVTTGVDTTGNLKTLPRTDTIGTYFRGTTIGNPCASINAKQVNYDPTRGTDGSLTLAVSLVANGFGLEWGKMLTAGLRTDTTATTGAFFDDGAATSFGGQAYFQLTAFSGTSVTIDIQSATTSGGSYTTTGLTSSALTTPGAQRVSVANNVTINEFLKVVTTGTFTNAVFAVHFTRNPIVGQVF